MERDVVDGGRQRALPRTLFDRVRRRVGNGYANDVGYRGHSDLDEVETVLDIMAHLQKTGMKMIQTPQIEQEKGNDNVCSLIQIRLNVV